MTRLKVMTVVGTRPELIKLSRVIAELDRHTDHVLVHTGQNYDYELNGVFFADLGIRRPDHFLEAVGETAAETIGRVIIAADPVIAREKPDALLVYGDTNSCLAALAAKRRKVPVFHMEAGNRCFDQRVPEEINRKIIDHISDVNLPLTEHARQYLLAEGLRPETVIKTGSPMREVLDFYWPGIEQSDILDRLGLRSRNYFVASAHREENVDDPATLTELLASLTTVAEEYDCPVVVSLHPRTRRRLETAGGILSPQLQFHKPFGFFDYIRLQTEARCVLSDSGTLTEEASLLGFPAVMLRQAHERPEGMDEGTAVMSGLSQDRVRQAVRLVTEQGLDQVRTFRIVGDYEPDNVSKKMVRIILSYTDFINRRVWSKQSRTA